MDQLPAESRFILALEAIYKDKNLSIRAAAKIYNVIARTIRDRRAGKAARRNIPANLRKLTDLEERAIVEYIIGLSTRLFLPRLRGVEDMANQLRWLLWFLWLCGRELKIARVCMGLSEKQNEITW